MIKPPSLVREYTWIWSKDPALDTPPDDAPEDALKAWAEKLQRARETGQWDGLIKAGQAPSKFTLRLIPGTQWRSLVDGHAAGRFGNHSVNALAVRCALRGVTNLKSSEEGDVKIEYRDVPGIGSVADEQIVNFLDSCDPHIVHEMADAIATRQAAPSPK